MTNLKKQKKITVVVLALVLIMSLLNSCGGSSKKDSKVTPKKINWPKDSICAVGLVTANVYHFDAGWKSYANSYGFDLDQIDTIIAPDSYEVYLIIPRDSEAEVIIESLNTESERSVVNELLKDGRGITLLYCNESDIRPNTRVTIRSGGKEAVFEPALSLADDVNVNPKLTGLPANVYDISLPPTKDAERFYGDWEQAKSEASEVTASVYSQLILSPDGVLEFVTHDYESDETQYHVSGTWKYNGEKKGGAELVFEFSADGEKPLKGTYLGEITTDNNLNLRLVKGDALLPDMKPGESHYFNFIWPMDGQSASVFSTAEEAAAYLSSIIKTNKSKLGGKITLMETGTELIGADECWVFAAGENTAEKFTALEHYAVGPSGMIFRMDTVSGEWVDFSFSE